MGYVLKRDHFYIMEGLYTRIVVKMLPYIGKTSLTPNMVTFFNIINAFFSLCAIWYGKYLLVAILVQVYLFLDILDGNLARYQKKSTKLGALLDKICDRFFYNGLIVVLGFKIGINPLWI